VLFRKHFFNQQKLKTQLTKAIIILMALCLYSNIKAQEFKKVAVISIAAIEN